MNSDSKISWINRIKMVACILFVSTSRPYLISLSTLFPARIINSFAFRGPPHFLSQLLKVTTDPGPLNLIRYLKWANHLRKSIGHVARKKQWPFRVVSEIFPETLEQAACAFLRACCSFTQNLVGLLITASQAAVHPIAIWHGTASADQGFRDPFTLGLDPDIVNHFAAQVARNVRYVPSRFWKCFLLLHVRQ